MQIRPLATTFHCGISERAKMPRRTSARTARFMLNFHMAGDINQSQALRLVRDLLAAAEGKFTTHPVFYGDSGHFVSVGQLEANPNQVGFFGSDVAMPKRNAKEFLRQIESHDVAYEAGPKSEIV